MKNSSAYKIAYVGLKQGAHKFCYFIEDKFFDNFSTPDFNNSAIEVEVNLEKQNNLFLMNFVINGFIETSCDRCGEPFKLRLWEEFKFVVKVVDDENIEIKNNEDPDIAYISKTSSMMDLSPWIYEFILLSIPYQRLHPNDENENSTCNPEILKLLNQNIETPNTALWDALNIKKENKN